MVGVDKYGFRLGSKRSIAAKLYERGATQAEVKAATDTTQYNMPKDAEKRGHNVRRKGDRFWLMPASAGTYAGEIGNEMPEPPKPLSAGSQGHRKPRRPSGSRSCPTYRKLDHLHPDERP